LGKKTPLWLIAVAAAVSLTASCLSREPAESRVVRVTDGDTVEMDSGVTVRYIGIDTPETSRKVSGQWVPAEDPFGQEAKSANEELVMGKKVRLEYDLEKKDKYGRTLAYIFVEGEGRREIFVQAELLRKGLAYLYTFPPNVKYVDVLMQAQAAAKQERAGMWAETLEIPGKEAANYLGQRKFVIGKVRKARRTEKVIFLEMEGLAAVIFTKDLWFFEKEDVDPLRDYSQKTITVFGLIKSYRGKTEIIVNHPWQIEVLD